MDKELHCYQLWRKWLLPKEILQKDLNPTPSNHLVCHRPNAPLAIWNCTQLQKWPRGCRYCHGKKGKKKRNKKATRVNSASINKECFSRTNVSFLLKESQLECHWKWQNRFNILAVKHSILWALRHKAKFVRGKGKQKSPALQQINWSYELHSWERTLK